MLALSVTALAIGLAPTSVGAHTVADRPDARIAKKCAGIPAWQNCNPARAGDDIYNGTGKNQKRVHVDYLSYGGEPDPTVVVFLLSIQNDGSVNDRFGIDANGTTVGYTLRFLRGSTDITAAVEAGSYTTPFIAPGESIVIKAKVGMPCPSHDDCGRDRAFDIAERVVTVRSMGDPAKRDAVKFVRRPWVCTC
jgi:hypothetical protein